MATATRVEKDPLGELEVPADALYGVQTMRARQNFPISGLRPLWPFVQAQVWLKQAAAMTHRDTGRSADGHAAASQTARPRVPRSIWRRGVRPVTLPAAGRSHAAGDLYGICMMPG